jgi:hypothetical protein
MMKRRHVILGCGVVLALALAVPALGGPLALRSGGSTNVRLLSQAKRVLKAATGAQRLAEAALSAAQGAQATAGEAKSAAQGAKAPADAAKSAATAAQNIAAGAEAEANGALGTANSALSATFAADASIQPTEIAAEQARNTASLKVKGVLPVRGPDGGGVPAGGDTKFSHAVCPAGKLPVGLGFEITEDAAEPHLLNALPQFNENVVLAQSAGNPFQIRAFGGCLEF